MHTLKKRTRRLLGHHLYEEIIRRVSGRRKTHAYGDRHIADPIRSNELIRALVSYERPAAIGKIGATELRAVLEYLEVSGGSRARVRREICQELYECSGVFPPTQDTLLRFAGDFINIISQMDLLVAWYRPGERAVFERHCPNAKLISFEGLDPFYVDQPWTAALAGKSVLVASPFIDSIGQQYQRRQLIWRDRPMILPEFKLQLMRLPFSAGLVASPYVDWFESMKALIADIQSRTFEVLLVGGGAFSLPLAVTAKRMGKIGIHLGGSTQILFGIRGARWDKDPIISKHFSDYWVRPNREEMPAKYKHVGSGSYW